MEQLRKRDLVVALAVLVGAAFLTGAEAQAQQPGTIKIAITNRTDQRVTCFLNGGQGLETRLDPGESQSYTVVVDAGVQPTVKIYQPAGGAWTFTLANGGRYSFRFKGGEIHNFFD